MLDDTVVLFLFIPTSDEGYIRPVTFWVVGDFDSPSGRQLLYDAIRHMVEDPFISFLLQQLLSEEL